MKFFSYTTKSYIFQTLVDNTILCSIYDHMEKLLKLLFLRIFFNSCRLYGKSSSDSFPDTVFSDVWESPGDMKTPVEAIYGFLVALAVCARK